MLHQKLWQFLRYIGDPGYIEKSGNFTKFNKYWLINQKIFFKAMDIIWRKRQELA